MQSLTDIGMNTFSKLKKLRIEHLSGSENDKIYNQFLFQLSQDQRLKMVKIESIFPDDPIRFSLLV